jgi:hypothetical protein
MHLKKSLPDRVPNREPNWSGRRGRFVVSGRYLAEPVETR